MNTASEEKIKLIFGLKVAQKRNALKMSLSALSKLCGISASYLNEIEKGKKYPKTDKIFALAQALEIEYDELVSLKLKNELAPIGELISSKMFSQLPFDLFGIDSHQLIELLSKNPGSTNAFIGGFIEIARQYNISESRLFAAALRSYQESFANYFEEIENSANQFLLNSGLNPLDDAFEDKLEDFLVQEYAYRVDSDKISAFPELTGIKSFYSENGGNTLYLEKSLSQQQLLFLLAKEIGFNFLDLPKNNRVNTYAGKLEIHGFKQLLINFNASYFAGAVLLPEQELVNDISAWFNQSSWNQNALPDLCDKWNASPETLFHRFTNLLPKHFGVDKLFFLKFYQNLDSEEPVLERELHLNKSHLPHASNIGGHYCGRWSALKVLEKAKHENNLVVDAQISDYMHSDDRYLVVSLARKLSNGRVISTCLGLMVNTKSKRTIKFMADTNLPIKMVNVHCEMCDAVNCQERRAEPKKIIRQNQRREIKNILKDF